MAMIGLFSVGAWIVAGLTFLLMFGGWYLGCRFSRKEDDEAGQSASKFTDACLATLGLLLAFTFAFAMNKHDARRAMVVTDANAIGDFATAIAMLPEPQRSRLTAVLRDYTKLRHEAVRQQFDDQQLEEMLKKSASFHNQMTEMVRQAVEAGTPVAVPLVNTLNEVTSAHAARLAALRDSVPLSIEVLLLISCALAMMLVGRNTTHVRRHLWPSLGFMILVASIVCVTFDLNDPRRGLITVSQEPIHRVIQSMEP